MEISNELRARIFKEYMPCTVTYPEAFTERKIKAILTGISFADKQIETTYKRKRGSCRGDLIGFESNKNHTCDLVNTKPILTPLFDITDDDALKCGSLCGLHTTGSKVIRMVDAVFIENDTYQMQISHNGYICLRKNGVLYNMDMRRVNDFLKEESHDMGYGDIPSLIKAGIAVSK